MITVGRGFLLYITVVYRGVFMGISERKEREREERRKMIMHCARELILTNGVERVSMGDIAKNSELSKATLYLYFPSKDDLFNEICEESASVFIESVKPLLKEGITGLEALKRYWMAYLEVFGRSSDMIILFSLRRYLFLSLPLKPGGENTKAATRYTYMLYYLIKDLIEQGIAEKSFDAGTDSDMVTRTILSLFFYIIENAAKLPKNEMTSQAVIEEMRNVFQIILRGIAREGIDRSFFYLPKADNLPNSF